MSSFKILEYGEKAESLYGIENKEITELELEALLEGKRLWTDINWEYAMTIRLKDRLKELDIDRENERLNNIKDKAIEYINLCKKEICSGEAETIINDLFEILKGEE